MFERTYGKTIWVFPSTVFLFMKSFNYQFNVSSSYKTIQVFLFLGESVLGGYIFFKNVSASSNFFNLLI